MYTYLALGALGASVVALAAAVLAWVQARRARTLAQALSPDTRKLLTVWRELEPQEAAGELASFLETLALRLRDLEKREQELDRRHQRALSQTAVVRFDNDAEVSGKLSFALALLNEHRDGYVLTSLYSLHGNRVFLRPVREGQVERELLPEEAEALRRALREGS